MDEFNIWISLDENYEDITSFDRTMFLANPMRAMKLAEFLSYFSEFGWMREKLMKASKDSWFWKIVDAFKFPHSKGYKNFWKANLSKPINDFLDELEKNLFNIFYYNVWNLKKYFVHCIFYVRLNLKNI